ncbi:MAG: holo-ACP synthase [Gemmatimonadales bacterium]
MALIGVGIDLVEVADADRLLVRWGERLLAKVLTSDEREYVLSHEFPEKHIAVRLAAKEAVYKALAPLPDARGVGWRDIEVVRALDGHPSVRLHGLAARIQQRDGPFRISLSLSHTSQTAGAVAVIER